MSLLGIDVGTTEVKVLLFDLETKTYYLQRRNYPLIFPERDYVEQNPQLIWDVTKQAIREVMKEAKREVSITSLSVSSQGGTLIPLNGNYNPLGNAIVWMDHRPNEENRRLKEKFGDDFFYLKTGWRLIGCLPLLQICWLREKQPHFFKKIRKFAFVGDYIIYKLSGEWVIDPSSAAMTMLYNLRKDAWDEELIEIAGISESQLPKIRKSGEVVGCVLPHIKKELGLSESEIIVVNGGHDQYCASLGAGAIEEGDLLLSGGTAWVLLLTLDKPIFDTRSYLSPGRHVIRGKWGLMSSIPAGGAGVNWFKDNFSYFIKGKIDEREFYSVLEEKSNEIPAGCDGLFFFPHFVGAGAPTWETSSKAVILGLSLHHGPPHIFKALLEGVGFEVLCNVKIFESLGISINTISMIGGAVRSRIWPQIISDILNRPLRVPRIQEAACVGAVILAGVGGNIFHNCQDGARIIASDATHIYPNGSNAKRYEMVSQLYLKFYQKLREIFKVIA